MATSYVLNASNVATDAQFRTWCSWVNTSLINCGWVQTADTGQINPATVTLPLVANTNAGYMIWGMNDALQATAPFFLKLTFGVGNPNTINRLIYQVGIATDGAGSFVGASTTARTLVNGIASGGGTFMVSSGSTSRITFDMWPDPSTPGNWNYFLNVERSRDLTGTLDAKGCTVMGWMNNASGAIWQQYLASSGVAGTTELQLPGYCSSIVPVNASQNKMTLFPIRFAFGPMQPPIIGVLITRVSLGSNIGYVTLYGVTRPYLCQPTGFFYQTNTVLPASAANTCKHLMLWE